VSRVIVAVHGEAGRPGRPIDTNIGDSGLRKEVSPIAIRYRLADRPENCFPAALIDVLAAIRFIQTKSISLASILIASP